MVFPQHLSRCMNPSNCPTKSPSRSHPSILSTFFLLSLHFLPYIKCSSNVLQPVFLFCVFIRFRWVVFLCGMHFSGILNETSWFVSFTLKNVSLQRAIFLNYYGFWPTTLPSPALPSALRPGKFTKCLLRPGNPLTTRSQSFTTAPIFSSRCAKHSTLAINSRHVAFQRNPTATAVSREAPLKTPKSPHVSMHSHTIFAIRKYRIEAQPRVYVLADNFYSRGRFTLFTVANGTKCGTLIKVNNGLLRSSNTLSSLPLLDRLLSENYSQIIHT